jgi:hypothetical protein
LNCWRKVRAFGLKAKLRARFANRNNYPYIKALADFDLGAFAGSLSGSFPKKAAGPLWKDFAGDYRMSAESKPGRFPELLRVRCPRPLPALIERTAERQCMSPSEYIRRSLFERLKADGVDPTELAGAA